MPRPGGPIRIGTRGSDLALRQADRVRSALERHRYEVELVEIETKGDLVPDELIHRLGTTGAFVRALDEHVLNGRVDAAVHSMKDVPTEGPTDLLIAAVPERARVGDLLVTPTAQTLDDLPAGAVVGTASLRRRAQLLAVREDLEVRPIRGNVDTRIEKLLGPHLRRDRERQREETDEAEGTDAETAERAAAEYANWRSSLSAIERRALDRGVEAEYDGLILAAAGLERTGLIDDVPTSDLPVSRFVPAPGQGAIAVTMLDTDLASTVAGILDDPRIRMEITVERTILSRLGGGCIAPIGIHAITQGEFVHTVVQVLDRTGTEIVEGTRDVPVSSYRTDARRFADELADRGASELIESARRNA